MAPIRSLVGLLFLALTSVVLAAPAPQTETPSGGPGGPGGGHGGPHGPPGGSRRCRRIDRRAEWRDIPIPQRIRYTNAVKCLNTLPSQDPSRGAQTRWDDFHLTHVLLTPRIHFVGQFLPWHRQFVTLYTQALRDECGYRGPTPYWDWTRDADAIATGTPFANSPIFDPVHGFGGDGVPGTYTLPPGDPSGEMEIPPFNGNPPAAELWKGCVQDGPFKDTDFTLHVGPGRMLTDHCLVRNLNPTNWTERVTSTRVNSVLATTDFETFRNQANSGPHLGGHAIIGGVMSNAFSSPGDPLFYLHHAGLDRVWWQWQNQDPARLEEISGPTLPNGPIQTTLDFEMDFPLLGPNVTVRDTMDASLQPNCFRYD